MYLFGAARRAPGRPDDDDCVRPFVGRVGGAEEPLVDRRHRRNGAVVRQVLLHPVVLKPRVPAVVFLRLYVDLEYSNKSLLCVWYFLL